jgi:hypothetical protein
MYGLREPEVAVGRKTGVAVRPAAAIAVLVGWFAPWAGSVARAEHNMATMSENHHTDESDLSAGLSVEAARFDNISYVGSYQGIMPSLGWMRGRFGAGAAMGLYHLTKNGLSRYGIGDAMFTGHATVLTTGTLDTGIAMHLMVPSGSEISGFGMGHVMAMPSAWGAWHSHRVTLKATAGYARALTELGGEGHDHGPSPLVDPMNMHELTWSTGVDLNVSHGVRLGGRALGGLAIGQGRDRVIGACHVGWGTSRFSTGFELQLGLAGDPFSVRGVVDTALRF